MKILKYFIVLVIGFFSGTYFGFHQAPEEFIYWSGQLNASSLVGDIKVLKTGKIEDWIKFKEFLLNDEIANHGRHLESRYAWLLSKDYKIGNEFIQRAVDHRLSNPYEESDWSPLPRRSESNDAGNNQLDREIIEAQKENQRLVNKVMALYGGDQKKLPSAQ